MDFKMDASEYSLIDIDKLRDLAVENSDSYRKKQPFPHAIFDCVYSEKMLDKVIKEFRNSDDSWREFNTKYEKKSQLCVEDDLGPVTRSLIHNLNSGPFLNFLEDLTGISGLIPDPYLVGGGLHKISQGGKLGIHVDFNKHKTMNVFRRINVIIYLNKDCNSPLEPLLKVFQNGSPRLRIRSLYMLALICIRRIIFKQNLITIFLHYQIHQPQYYLY